MKVAVRVTGHQTALNTRGLTSPCVRAYVYRGLILLTEVTTTVAKALLSVLKASERG